MSGHVHVVSLTCRLNTRTLTKPLLAMWPEMASTVAVATVQGRVAVLARAPMGPHSLTLGREKSHCAVGQLRAPPHSLAEPWSLHVGFTEGPCGVFCMSFLEQ